MSKFSKRLKELRTDEKLSQAALGLAIGYSQQTIADWENDRIIPNMTALIKLAQFFETSIDYLVGLKDF